MARGCMVVVVVGGAAKMSFLCGWEWETHLCPFLLALESLQEMVVC